MKIRKLLVLSAFGLTKSCESKKDYYKKNTDNKNVPWRIAFNVTELYAPYPNLGVYAGTCLWSPLSSSYLGLSYSFKEFEINNWNFEFKIICPFLHQNMFQRKDYLKTVPILGSLSLIWSTIKIGVCLGASYNKDMFISFSVSRLINDYVNVEFQNFSYGKSAFFSNSIKIGEVKKWRDDCIQFLNEFVPYYRQKVSPSEETDEIILKHVCNYFKENVMIAERYLNGQDYEALLENGRSIGIIGPTGAGKTYCLDLIKNFCKEKDLDSISFVHVQASEVTPTGYYGLEVNEVIKEGMDRNIDNGCSKLSVMRSILMVDEIDSTKQEKFSGFNKGSNMQKEWLPVVDGTKLIDTTQGEIPTIGMFRIFPGAYQEKQTEIDSLSRKEILEKTESSSLQALNSLSNYIRKNSYNRDDENFNILTKELRNASRSLQSINDNFIKFVEKSMMNRTLSDNDFNLLGDYFKKFDFESLFKSHSTSFKKVSDAAQNVRKDILNIDNEKYNDIFDDIYYDFLEILCNFHRLNKKSYFSYIDLLSKIEKRKNSRKYVERVGLGGELCRRNENGIFFLNTPELTRTKRILHKKLDEELNSKLNFYNREVYDEFLSCYLNQMPNYGYGYEYKTIDELANQIANACVPELDRYDPNNQFIGIDCFYDGLLYIRAIRNESLEDRYLKNLSAELIEDINKKIDNKWKEFKSFEESFLHIIRRFSIYEKNKLLNPTQGSTVQVENLDKSLIEKIFNSSLDTNHVDYINNLLINIIDFLRFKEMGLSDYENYFEEAKNCLNGTKLDESGNTVKSYDAHALVFIFNKIQNDIFLEDIRNDSSVKSIIGENSNNEELDDKKRIKYIIKVLEKYQKSVESVDQDKKNLNELKQYIYDIVDLYKIKDSVIKCIKDFFDENNSTINVNSSKEELDEFFIKLKDKALKYEDSRRKEFYAQCQVFKYIQTLKKS